MYNYINFLNEDQILNQLAQLQQKLKIHQKVRAEIPEEYSDDIREWFKSLQEIYELAFCFDISIRRDRNRGKTWLILEKVKEFDFGYEDGIYLRRISCLQGRTFRAKPLVRKWNRFVDSFNSGKDVVLEAEL